MIKVTIPLLPKAQKRHRSAAYRRGSDGKWFSRAYKSPEQQESEEDLMSVMMKHVPEKPLEGALATHILACFPLPKSRKKAEHKALEVFGWLPHDKKPDKDNLDKQIMDVCTKLGFWYDDSQVTFSITNKIYTVNKPCWEVLICTIDEVDMVITEARKLWEGRR